MQHVLAAEYTNGSKRRPATLTINVIANGQRDFVSQHNVADKAEARRLARSLNATPWNF